MQTQIEIRIDREWAKKALGEALLAHQRDKAALEQYLAALPDSTPYPVLRAIEVGVMQAEDEIDQCRTVIADFEGGLE